MHAKEPRQLVIDELGFDPGIVVAELGVAAQNGVIMLSGHVSDCIQKVAAERATGRVKCVSNGIQLQSTVRVGDVKRRIQDALKRHAEFEADEVRVDVCDDGMVRLDGRVENRGKLQAVKQAVWSAPGVQSIDDHPVIG